MADLCTLIERRHLRSIMDLREASPPGSVAWHEADLALYRAIMTPRLPRAGVVLPPDEGLVEDVQRSIRGIVAVALAQGVPADQAELYVERVASEVAWDIMGCLR